MPEWTPGDLKRQFLHLPAAARGAFQQSAKAHGIPLPLWLAIGSRETNLTNELGDGNHGVGYVQVDVRSHEIARQMKADGTWKTQPGKLLDYGAALLAQNHAAVLKQLPGIDAHGAWKVACSAYNTGLDRAIEDSRDHGDSDRRTTGGDYGADVLNRAATFAQLLGVEAP